ncbi:hypothetical protein BGX26_003660 [Mortierella sp. AD094]|nr:hypothetical protein BGX26_003660 [Mortierella sp. AD094]
MWRKYFDSLDDSIKIVTGRVDELEKRLDQISLLLPSSPESKKDLGQKNITDNLDGNPTTISSLPGFSPSSSNGPTSEPASEDQILMSSSTDAEEGSPIDRLERPEQTAIDVTSASSSMDIVTDNSQLPAYSDMKPSELVRLQNKIECAKNALFGAMVQPAGCTSKPPPPTILAPGQDDIFVAWCMSLCGCNYKRALVKIIEELQVQEEKKWKDFGLSNAHAQDNNDSMYRKHLRVKIESAKRSVTDYHLKRIAGTLKDRRWDGMSRHTSPQDVDVDVLIIGCLRAKEFDKFVLRDGRVNSYMKPYDHSIGDLIAGLLKKEEDEMNRLLQLKASGKGEKR